MRNSEVNQSLMLLAPIHNDSPPLAQRNESSLAIKKVYEKSRFIGTSKKANARLIFLNHLIIRLRWNAFEAQLKRRITGPSAVFRASS